MEPELYILIDNLFNNSKYAYGEQREATYNTGKAKICQECNNPISMLEWLPPYEINVSKKNLGDLIFGTYAGFLVSNRFKDKFEKTNLNGLHEFNKVDLYYRNKLLTEEYYYPKISMITAFIDTKRVKFENKKLCNTCQKGSSVLSGINGVYFLNYNQINKDIFFTTTLGESFIIISEYFNKFLKKNNFNNIELVNASKYVWDSFSPASV